MPRQVSTPDELYDQYIQNATARTRASLKIVHTVCREQHEEHKSKDFSVATIGKLVKKRGGPSEAAIRNKQGQLYKALILAWAKHVGGESVKKATKEHSQIEQALQGIEDPGLRAIALNLYSHNKKLQRQVNLQRKELEESKVIDMRPIVRQSGQQILSGADSIGLSSYEVQALKDAVSERKLLEEGWIESSNGRITTEKGREVYPPNYLGAIKKVLSFY